MWYLYNIVFIDLEIDLISNKELWEIVVGRNFLRRKGLVEGWEMLSVLIYWSF